MEQLKRQEEWPDPVTALKKIREICENGSVRDSKEVWLLQIDKISKIAEAAILKSGNQC